MKLRLAIDADGPVARILRDRTQDSYRVALSGEAVIMRAEKRPVFAVKGPQITDCLREHVDEFCGSVPTMGGDHRLE